MLALALAGTALADCPRPLPPDAWSQVLDAAEQRFRDLDTAGYRDAMEDAGLAVPCLASAVAPELASRFHLLHGLAAFTRGDKEAARLSFAAARATRPDAHLDFGLVPEGHEVHELVQTAATPGATAAADPPQKGELFFDGTPGDARPVDRPTLAQWIGPGGDAGSSGWLRPGDAMIAYPLKPAKDPDGPEPGGPPSPLRLGLGAGGGALLLGGGVVYGLAASQAGKVRGPHGPEVTVDDLEGHQRRANRFVGMSAVLGGLGAAGLVGFVVVK